MKTWLLQSGTVYDVALGCEGRIQDIAVRGETIVSLDEVSQVDEIVDASGFVVTAAAVDCAAHVAFPGVWHLRAAGLFPDAETIVLRYAQRGFGHVHESWTTLEHAGLVREAWNRLPGLQASIGLCLPLYELTSWIESQDAETAGKVIEHLCRFLGSHGFYLSEPRLRFRNEVYKHREKSAEDLLPFLSKACAHLPGPLMVPATGFSDEDVQALPFGVHLQRITELLEPRGDGAALSASQILQSDCASDTAFLPGSVGVPPAPMVGRRPPIRGKPSPFDFHGQVPPLGADLGLAWPEKSVQLTWVPPSSATEGYVWDVGTYRLLKAEPLPNHDFRNQSETLELMTHAAEKGWAFSCRHANLALVEDWQDLVDAVLNVLSLREWFLATRLHAAKALGLTNKGHLCPGAQADVALYREPSEDTPAGWAQTLSRCQRLYVKGRLVYDASRGDRVFRTKPEILRPLVRPDVDKALLDPVFEGLSLRPQTLSRLGPYRGS